MELYTFCVIQRFGQGTRNHLLEATTIYVVEPKYLDGHTKKVDPTLKINLSK
jgi:hypothetical protein